MTHLDAFTAGLSTRRSVVNALRRRIWHFIFERSQRRLGTFFLDAQDVLGSERLITGDLYESSLLEIIAHFIRVLKLGGGVAVDAGANIGNHACWLSSRFNYVVCVEPGRVAALVLEANLIGTGKENWEIHRCALGEDRARGSLQSTHDNNLGSSRVRICCDNYGEFPVLRGDMILTTSAHPELPVELIKIDVEGAEVAVLRGLNSTISRWQPLLCVEVLDETRWSIVHALLIEHGYCRFIAPQPVDRARGLFARIYSTAIGKRLQLTELSRAFPDGGYSMIFCLSEKHVFQLGW